MREEAREVRVVALRGADEKFSVAVGIAPEARAEVKSVAVSWEKAVEVVAAREASTPPVGTPALGRVGELNPGGGVGGITDTVDALDTWVRMDKMLVAVVAVEAAVEAVTGVLDMTLRT